ncbi:MAG: hypothetical protein PHS57_10735 [Alphaproteobacteria bacterium]|nr:hypothetical protein [Alphaproteobacteria bacterium]
MTGPYSSTDLHRVSQEPCDGQGPKARISVEPAGIPDALKRLNQWVVWSYRLVDGKQKKPPLNPRTMRDASTNDPHTWSDFEHALAVYEDGKADGIGVVMRAGSGVVGIDLDRCIDENGNVEPNALRIVEMINSYTELSPSGTGLHVFALADLPVARRSGPVELYGTSQYLTVTGCVFGDHHLMRAAQAEVEKLHAAITPPPVSTPSPRTPSAPPREYPRRLDREIIDRASSSRSGAKFRALWNGDSSGYSSGSEADAALLCMLLYWTDGDRDRADALFRQSGLMRPKWERPDYRERTFAAAERVRT